MAYERHECKWFPLKCLWVIVINEQWILLNSINTGKVDYFIPFTS